MVVVGGQLNDINFQFAIYSDDYVSQNKLSNIIMVHVP